MDFAGVPSPHMNWESSNLPDAWRKFRQHAELMFAGLLKKRGEDENCSYLLLWIGEKGRDIFNTWTLTTEEAKVLQTYYDKYEAYVMPKTNIIFARYKFHERIQGATETFEQFVTELRLLVKDCAYADSEEMVRDRIVFGIHSPRVREKLLSVGSELTLDKAMDIARSHEIAQAQLKTFANSPHDQVVHAVNTRKESHKRTVKALHWSSNDVAERDKTCGYCGNQAHSASNKCPARGKQCAKCGKRNHFAKVCRSAYKRNVHAVGKEALCDEEDTQSEFFVDAVLKKSCDTEQAFADIQLGN
ncbi:uncharacterized protein [Misgurnus anguillicaudatus]|uniref:uncharacterized protein isoform X1 n=1 Tax=Misgurnus anguillicaudatus TaxID=75329 RepID=UPI003CCF9ECA